MGRTVFREFMVVFCPISNPNIYCKLLELKEICQLCHFRKSFKPSKDFNYRFFLRKIAYPFYLLQTIFTEIVIEYAIFTLFQIPLDFIL